AEVVSAALLLCVIPVVSSQAPSLASVLWGAAAGVSGAGGALALYLGFRHAEFSVASSVSAVGTAVFSVLAGVALGERPGALSLAGILLAVAAIVGVSAPAREAGRGLWDAAPRRPPGRGGGGAGRRRRVRALLHRPGSGGVGHRPVAHRRLPADRAGDAHRHRRRDPRPRPATARDAPARPAGRGGRSRGNRPVLPRHPPRPAGHHRGDHLALPGRDDPAGPGAAGRAADPAAACRALLCPRRGRPERGRGGRLGPPRSRARPGGGPPGEVG